MACKDRACGAGCARLRKLNYGVSHALFTRLRSRVLKICFVLRKPPVQGILAFSRYFADGSRPLVLSAVYLMVQLDCI